MPDVKGTVTNAFASGKKVTLEVTWEGTHTGPLTGSAGTWLLLPDCKSTGFRKEKDSLEDSDFPSPHEHLIFPRLLLTLCQQSVPRACNTSPCRDGFQTATA